MVTVRRRATREKYGRRGKKGDPEYGLKGLLNRNLEDLPPEQFSKIIETLDADGQLQQIVLAWIAKEKLRAALNLRTRADATTGWPSAAVVVQSMHAAGRLM
jgi:transposase